MLLADVSLRRASLRDQVLSAVRDALVTGQLVPGVVYSAAALAADLGVSNSPVREAMLGELSKIAGQCDGVRCDMAMLLLPEVIQKTWGDKGLPADGVTPDKLAAIRATVGAFGADCESNIRRVARHWRSRLSFMGLFDGCKR